MHFLCQPTKQTTAAEKAPHILLPKRHQIILKAPPNDAPPGSISSCLQQLAQILPF
jgi:hypothetical protein